MTRLVPQSSRPHKVVETFLDRIVHDDQVLRGDKCRELGNHQAAAANPMVNAAVVFEGFRPDMCNHVLRQTIKIRRKIVWHALPPPHERKSPCAPSRRGCKLNVGFQTQYKHRLSNSVHADVHSGASYPARHFATASTTSSRPSTIRPTSSVPIYFLGFRSNSMAVSQTANQSANGTINSNHQSDIPTPDIYRREHTTGRGCLERRAA